MLKYKALTVTLFGSFRFTDYGARLAPDCVRGGSGLDYNTCGIRIALNQTKLAQVAQVAQGQVEKAAGQGGQVRHQQMVEFL